MWDTIHGEAAYRRAEANFEYLSSKVWKELINRGAGIHRFYNTQRSAIQIIDSSIDKTSVGMFQFEMTYQSPNCRYNTPFGVNLHEDLITRIGETEATEKHIVEQLSDAVASREEDELIEMLELQLGEVRTSLDNLWSQLEILGSPAASRRPIMSSPINQPLGHRASGDPSAPQNSTHASEINIILRDVDSTPDSIRPTTDSAEYLDHAVNHSQSPVQ
ncbi:hypothetical protein CVT24_006891 [Panaeolus cyanescens]|uniref:Uncharacterized protein n=1 Tax=Panaeolus cyanescens TaxID=181874 RepID=A0A409W045_9AGAR|nr:hypothetical protein CVT24_006891 [Panaeolus cyanescens]